MTISSKPDFTLNSAGKPVKAHQTLNQKNLQSNKTEDAPAAVADQDADSLLSGRPLSDTIDISVNAEIGAKPAASASSITSVAQAAEAAGNLNRSILENPEEAMLAQTSGLPQSVLELIQ